MAMPYPCATNTNTSGFCGNVKSYCHKNITVGGLQWR